MTGASPWAPLNFWGFPRIICILPLLLGLSLNYWGPRPPTHLPKFVPSRHPGLDVELAVGGEPQLLRGHVQDAGGGPGR